MTDHSLPVTDLLLGHGATNTARLVSARLDMTVKIYSLTRGNILLSVSLNKPVTSLAMVNTETVVWADLQSREVARVSLLSPPRDSFYEAELLDTVGISSTSPSH